jgi:hypothetical protein
MHGKMYLLFNLVTLVSKEHVTKTPSDWLKVFVPVIL